MEPYLLQHLLAASAKQHPMRPAVLQGESVISYAALEEQSSRLAAALARLGMAPGDRVGILLPKSPEAVVAIYGILRAGGIYVPLDPAAPVSRLAGILERCHISVLISSPELAAGTLADPAAERSLRTLILVPDGCVGAGKASVPWAEALAGPAGTPETGALADTRPAYILHTSGSTGTPKGVVISHRNALTFVQMAAAFFDIGPADRLASHAPFHFDLSVFDLFTAAAAGAAVVLVPDAMAIFPSRLAAFIDRTGITVWNSVASVLALLAEHGRLEELRFGALRLVIFSGDVLSAKHLRRAMQAMPGAVFYNIYGQTEANSSTYYRVASPPANDRWKIPIGRPFPNFEVYALDERQQPIRLPGDVGEIYVGGGTVALGYWRDQERSAASFVENPLRPWPERLYRTGDLATLDENGDLLFLGRRDRQVKSRGYRIQMDEIDLALTSHPQVREAATVDLPDALLGARILGFVQCSGSASEADLLDFCSRTLPPYMLPERIVLIDEFPRTATGKIDRRCLRERFAGGTGGLF